MDQAVNHYKWNGEANIWQHVSYQNPPVKETSFYLYHQKIGIGSVNSSQIQIKVTWEEHRITRHQRKQLGYHLSLLQPWSSQKCHAIGQPSNPRAAEIISFHRMAHVTATLDTSLVSRLLHSLIDGRYYWSKIGLFSKEQKRVQGHLLELPGNCFLRAVRTWSAICFHGWSDLLGPSAYVKVWPPPTFSILQPHWQRFCLWQAILASWNSSCRQWEDRG